MSLELLTKLLDLSYNTYTDKNLTVNFCINRLYYHNLFCCGNHSGTVSTALKQKVVVKPFSHSVLAYF